jgi:hypothetical protein
VKSLSNILFLLIFSSSCIEENSLEKPKSFIKWVGEDLNYIRFIQTSDNGFLFGEPQKLFKLDEFGNRINGALDYYLDGGPRIPFAYYLFKTLGEKIFVIEGYTTFSYEEGIKNNITIIELNNPTGNEISRSTVEIPVASRIQDVWFPYSPIPKFNPADANEIAILLQTTDSQQFSKVGHQFIAKFSLNTRSLISLIDVSDDFDFVITDYILEQKGNYVVFYVNEFTSKSKLKKVSPSGEIINEHTLFNPYSLVFIHSSQLTENGIIALVNAAGGTHHQNAIHLNYLISIDDSFDLNAFNSEIPDDVFFKVIGNEMVRLRYTGCLEWFNVETFKSQNKRYCLPMSVSYMRDMITTTDNGYAFVFRDYFSTSYFFAKLDENGEMRN